MCVLILGAACDDKRRGQKRRSAAQWNEMRLGGQYVAKTSPIRL